MFEPRTYLFHISGTNSHCNVPNVTYCNNKSEREKRQSRIYLIWRWCAVFDNLFHPHGWERKNLWSGRSYWSQSPFSFPTVASRNYMTSTQLLVTKISKNLLVLNLETTCIYVLIHKARHEKFLFSNGSKSFATISGGYTRIVNSKTQMSGNKLPNNLPQLQNLIKRDPGSYKDEVNLM